MDPARIGEQGGTPNPGARLTDETTTPVVTTEHALGLASAGSDSAAVDRVSPGRHAAPVRSRGAERAAPDIDGAIVLGRQLVANLSHVLLGHAGSAHGGGDRRPVGRPPSHRGRPRCGQDGPGPGPGPVARSRPLASPGTSRSPALRRHRRLGLLARRRHVGVPSRSGVRPRGARRRAQSHPAAHPGRPPRDHGGAAGERGRRVVSTAPPPPRDRHPEPALAARDLSRWSRASSTGSRWPPPSGIPTPTPKRSSSSTTAGSSRSSELGPVCTTAGWLDAQHATETVAVAPAIAEYAVTLCRASRSRRRRPPRCQSPRRDLAHPLGPGPRRACRPAPMSPPTT